MGRRRDSVPVRLPGDLWRSRGGPEGPPGEVALRLAVSRQGLGLELGRPVALGAGMRLDEVVTSLPHLRFPVDLSGGVPRFRHCRGRLERLVVALGREPLMAWSVGALDGLLGEGKVALSVVPVAGGVSLGVSTEGKAIAWELAWAPMGRDLCFVVSRARALGVDAPAVGLALHATARLLGGWARRQGSVFRVEDAPRVLLQEVFPRAGARLPSTDGAVWSRVEVEPEALRLVAEQSGSPVQVSAEAVKALEVAELLVDGDEALVDGEREAARDAYLRALERAPRQREIVLRLADLDRAEGGRVEAALSTLVSAIPAVDGGALGGVLLAAVADREGARVAFERAAASEPHAALAALCLVAAAALVDSPGERASLLSSAVVRSPLLREARWRRLEALLSLGDARGALADTEHLEASVSGSAARVEVLQRAGQMMLSRGMAEQAIAVFERALRARPSSEDGLVGLAEAMFRVGEAARAADVLGRAVALGEARGRPDARATVLLARVLAEGLNELPLAIARARSVFPDSPEALPARHIEARALSQLGDRTGASVAYTSLREAIEHGRAFDPGAAVGWLSEAARFEEESRGDLSAAKRHLGVALRLRPRDPALLATFRRVAEAHEAEQESLRRSAQVTSPVAPGASSWSADPGPRQAPGAAIPATSPVSQPASPSPALPGGVADSLPLEAAVLAAPPVAVPPPVEVPVMPPVPPARVATEVHPDDAEAAEQGHPDDTELPYEEIPARPAAEARRAPMSLDLGEDETRGSAEDEVRADSLAERVRADPTNLEVVLELSGLLEKLGRDLDLFALLSARLEEGDEETRETLRPLQIAVLRRLAEGARREGRGMEATLYEQMLEMVESGG